MGQTLLNHYRLAQPRPIKIALCHLRAEEILYVSGCQSFNLGRQIAVNGKELDATIELVMLLILIFTGRMMTDM
jgi:hypothetical protein